MNEIQKSEAYKKDCMNMILELEKEKFLQLQLVQKCRQKMEDFHEECKRKVRNYQHELEHLLSQCDVIDKYVASRLEYLHDDLHDVPEFNAVVCIILFFVLFGISWIIHQGYGYEYDILLVLPWIIAPLLCLLPKIICLIPKIIELSKTSTRLHVEAENEKQLIREKANSYDIDKFKKEIDDKICAFDKKVNEEIDVISRGIDEISKTLDTLYSMIEDFPEEFRGDLGAVAAIASHLNKVGECNHKYWRMALFDAERVVGLRKVDNRLSDFENRMVEFSAELQSEIEMMIEDYNEEINDIMDSYIEMNDDLQEKQISVERRYQRNVDKANSAALKYIGEYHIY